MSNMSEQTITVIKASLEKDYHEFYNLGIASKVSQIKPNLEAINANVNNANLSGGDFRKFIGTIIPQLLDKVC